MDLDRLRGKIDEVDGELVKLFCERMRICADIARFKAGNGLPVRDLSREEGKLAVVLSMADADLREYLSALFQRIFELSRSYQGKILQGTGSCAVGKRFGVLGERLGHSFSPLIHSMFADYEYNIYEQSPDEVEGFLRRGDFDGLNVTMPYKKMVIPFCASLSGTAERVGSVNTLVRRGDGALHGDNTDYFGFLYLLEKAKVDVRGKKILVLGNGGAAAAVRAVLGDCGAGEVVTISRRGPEGYDNIGRHSDAQVVVNTTPVGMFPGNGASPVDPGVFSSCEAVLDIITNPLKTELMLLAEDRGIPCAGGLYMLVAQAARASELFAGRAGAGVNLRIDAVKEGIERKMRNVALVGMPGCGKTTVGRSLAELMRREFYDVDELVAERAGKPIERIFAEDAEPAFRDLESSVLSEVSKKTGSVIAAGGGVVERAENRRLLRQNSVVVFLDREPGELPTEGRPLSQSSGVWELYKKRLPLYLEWGEHKIKARSGAKQTALAVIEELGVRN